MSQAFVRQAANHAIHRCGTFRISFWMTRYRFHCFLHIVNECIHALPVCLRYHKVQARRQMLAVHMPPFALQLIGNSVKVQLFGTDSKNAHSGIPQDMQAGYCD
ncbi:hypothetical protein D3C77_724340 [compost metagenome]